MDQQPDSGSQKYEIKLQGHLNESWTEWFEGLAFTHESDGTTTLTGNVTDQAALHGLLKKIRDLGLALLAVNQVELHPRPNDLSAGIQHDGHDGTEN
jgi:hypothetical protein